MRLILNFRAYFALLLMFADCGISVCSAQIPTFETLLSTASSALKSSDYWFASAELTQAQFLIDGANPNRWTSRSIHIPAGADLGIYLDKVSTSYRAGDLGSAQVALRAVRRALSEAVLNPSLTVRAAAGETEIAKHGSNSATLNHAARIAYMSGMFKKAEVFAADAIENSKEGPSISDDSLLMESHNLRGAARLAQGDVAGAADDLSLSVSEVSGFGPRGPSMLLAKKFLEQSKFTPVLNYFSSLLSKASAQQQSTLSGWQAQILQHEVPDFGSNGLR